LLLKRDHIEPANRPVTAVAPACLRPRHLVERRSGRIVDLDTVPQQFSSPSMRRPII